MSSWHPGLVRSPADWTQHQNAGVWHSLCSLRGDALRCFLLLHPSSGFLAIVWGKIVFLLSVKAHLNLIYSVAARATFSPKLHFQGPLCTRTALAEDCFPREKPVPLGSHCANTRNCSKGSCTFPCKSCLPL